MSELVQKDFRHPMNSKSITKVRGVIMRALSEQTAAATAAGGVMAGANPSTHSGKLRSLVLVCAAVAAAGESLVIDVKKNGTTILTGAYTYDATKAPKTNLDLMGLLAADVDLVPGDLLTVDRTYTAGGGPTPIGPNAVFAEWS